MCALHAINPSEREDYARFIERLARGSVIRLEDMSRETTTTAAARRAIERERGFVARELDDSFVILFLLYNWEGFMITSDVFIFNII